MPTPVQIKEAVVLSWTYRSTSTNFRLFDIHATILLRHLH